MGLVLSGTNNTRMIRLIGRKFHKPSMISKDDYTPFICKEGEEDLMVPVKNAMLRLITGKSVYYFEYTGDDLSYGILRRTTNPCMRGLIGETFDLTGDMTGHVSIPSVNGDVIVTTVIDSQLVITTQHSVYDFRSA